MPTIPQKDGLRVGQWALGLQAESLVRTWRSPRLHHMCEFLEFFKSFSKPMLFVGKFDNCLPDLDSGKSQLGVAHLPHCKLWARAMTMACAQWIVGKESSTTMCHAAMFTVLICFDTVVFDFALGCLWLKRLHKAIFWVLGGCLGLRLPSALVLRPVNGQGTQKSYRN